MIVLESIAKSIDPEIKILKCAFPYFKYVDPEGRSNIIWTDFLPSILTHYLPIPFIQVE